MSITDIHIPLFGVNILIISRVSDLDQEKLEKALTYYEYVRQCWINHNKCQQSDDPQTIDVQYEAAGVYLNTFCQQYQSQIKVLSFKLLTDVVNWFHSNKISFIVHDCHEYEVNSMTSEQLETLNGIIASKYGMNLKFVPLI